MQIPAAQILPPVQTVPHVPQFWTSLVRLVQVPAQTSGHCGGQTHVPALQTRRPVQTAPQVPQFWLSVARLRQLPAQSVSPGGQRQTPAWQVLPPVQVLPQAPQFAGSPVRSRQMPLQQPAPGPHAPPQVPQFCGSDDSVRHVPPQLVWEVGQQMLPGPPGEQEKLLGQPNASWHSARSILRQFARVWPVRPSQSEVS